MFASCGSTRSNYTTVKTREFRVKSRCAAHLLPDCLHAELARVHAVVEERGILPVVVVGLQEEPAVRWHASQLPYVHRVLARPSDHTAVARRPAAEDEVGRREQTPRAQTQPAWRRGGWDENERVRERELGGPVLCGDQGSSLGRLVSLVHFEQRARHDSVPLLVAHAEDPLDDADEAAVRVEALVHSHAKRFLRACTRTWPHHTFSHDHLLSWIWDQVTGAIKYLSAAGC